MNLKYVCMHPPFITAFCSSVQIYPNHVSSLFQLSLQPHSKIHTMLGSCLAAGSIQDQNPFSLQVNQACACVLICLNKPHQRGIRTRVRFKWTKCCMCESILKKLARKVHIASGADYRCAYRPRSHRTQKQSHEWKSFTLMWGRASGQI